MATADDELRRRRERGRRSQAAYRERQAEATRFMIHQNELLKEQIGQLALATRGDERPELLNAILNLTKTAGIEVENFEAFKKLEEKDDADAIIDVVTEDSSYETETQSVTLAESPPHASLTGCKQPHAEPRVTIQKGLAHSEALKGITMPFLVSMVEARLEYKKTGAISPRNAAAGEADLGMVLQRQVNQEYKTKGQDPNLWLTCVSLEAHVRRMFGEYAFGLLEDAFECDDRSSLQDLANNIICELYDSGVCFGDGPRWKIDVVDKLFLDRIGEVLVSGL